MEFEWDEIKRRKILIDRGFDLRDICDAFLDPQRIVQPDSRRDYGELRYIMLARLEDRVYHVAYTIRDGRIRIITAFKANEREQRRYDRER